MVGCSLARHVIIFIRNTSFTSNYGYGESAGAIGTDRATSLTISSSLFEENHSRLDGGAIHIQEGFKTVLSCCNFTRNQAYSGGGGAIALSKSDLKVTNVAFQNNSAAIVGGGAIKAKGNSTMNITDSNFSGNKIIYPGNGGAIWASNYLKVYLRNVTFTENFPNGRGGVVYIERNTILELNDSYIYNNYNNNFGGGVFVDSNSFFIAYNSTFKGNKAAQGACLYVVQGEAYFENCLFNGNGLIGGTLVCRSHLCTGC